MPESDIDIREATEADIPVLVRARRLMFEELDDYDTGLLDRVDAAFDDYLRVEMRAGRVSGWVAIDRASGEWVGAVANEWIVVPATPNVRRPLRASLYGLFVRSGYRRRGIARSLVNAATDAARTAGAGAVQLHASEYGRPLYESLGFKPTTEMRLILDADAPQGC